MIEALQNSHIYFTRFLLHLYMYIKNGLFCFVLPRSALFNVNFISFLLFKTDEVK